MTLTVKFEESEYAAFCCGKLANPYPIYQQLREQEPVHWSEGFSAWLLTSYDNVLTALGDERLESAPRLSTYMNQLPSAFRVEVEPLYTHYATWLTNVDPPRHTRLRNLVHKAFTPRVVNNLRPFIKQRVDELIESKRETGRIEIVRELAGPLPSAVIAKMLGIPERDWSRFEVWSRHISDFAGTGRPFVEKAKQAQQAMQSMSGFVREFVSNRTKDAEEGLIAALAAAAVDGDRLSEDELIGMSVFLLVAGHETTMALIVNGLLSLLQHPEETGKLCQKPELIGSAIEEILRYESPLQHQVRVAREDLEISGCSIRQGERLVLFLGAANRDPEQFPEPDRFEISRNPNRHLAFGHGIHFCVGAALARLEAAIVIQELFQRFPSMRLATPHLEWRQHTSNRHVVKLEVGF